MYFPALSSYYEQETIVFRNYWKQNLYLEIQIIKDNYHNFNSFCLYSCGIYYMVFYGQNICTVLYNLCSKSGRTNAMTWKQTQSIFIIFYPSTIICLVYIYVWYTNVRKICPGTCYVWKYRYMKALVLLLLEKSGEGYT